MTYSIDMRIRAVGLVSEGRSRQEVCDVLKIDRKTLYNWLRRDNLHPRSVITRHRKIDRKELAAHVIAFPDALLRERAACFNVDSSCLSRMLKKLRVTKKNDAVSGSEVQ
jgi:transposase